MILSCNTVVAQWCDIRYIYQTNAVPSELLWLSQDLTREELRAGLDASLPTFAGCFAVDCRKANDANVGRLKEVTLTAMFCVLYVERSVPVATRTLVVCHRAWLYVWPFSICFCRRGCHTVVSSMV